jgi:SAM-dependent methyltransferase
MAKASIRVARCPACASEITGVYLDRSEEELGPAAIGSSRTLFSAGQILRCSKCRHGFRASQPTSEELGELYREMDTDVYESEESARSRTARRHVGLLNRRVGCSGKLLDIGCASGLFLDQAARSGWDVFGVEPNPVLSSKAAGRVGKNRICSTTLEEANLDASSFDAITMWDLLEHVADLPGFLQLCARLLKPAGRILVKVPDFDSLQARLMRARWPLLLPEHLGYFTRASLRACSERANLRVVGFGRGRVTYSSGYVLRRLGQHGFPGARIGYGIVGRSFLGRIPISIRLGELYAFFALEPIRSVRV